MFRKTANFESAVSTSSTIEAFSYRYKLRFLQQKQFILYNSWAMQELLSTYFGVIQKRIARPLVLRQVLRFFQYRFKTSQMGRRRRRKIKTYLKSAYSLGEAGMTSSEFFRDWLLLNVHMRLVGSGMFPNVGPGGLVFSAVVKRDQDFPLDLMGWHSDLGNRDGFDLFGIWLRSQHYLNYEFSNVSRVWSYLFSLADRRLGVLCYQDFEGIQRYWRERNEHGGLWKRPWRLDRVVEHLSSGRVSRKLVGRSHVRRLRKSPLYYYMYRLDTFYFRVETGKYRSFSKCLRLWFHQIASFIVKHHLRAFNLSVFALVNREVLQRYFGGTPLQVDRSLMRNGSKVLQRYFIYRHVLRYILRKRLEYRIFLNILLNGARVQRVRRSRPVPIVSAPMVLYTSSRKIDFFSRLRSRKLSRRKSVYTRSASNFGSVGIYMHYRHLVINRRIHAITVLPVPQYYFIGLLVNQSRIWLTLLAFVFSYYKHK